MDDEDWLSAAQAAAVLGLGADHVAWLAQRGHLIGQQRARRSWWVTRASVDALATDRASWVSWDAAVELVGCPRSRIAAAVRAGTIESRAHLGTKQPSLRRASVEEYASVWAQQQRLRAEQAALPAHQPARPTRAAPDDGHVWLGTSEVALILGLTRTGVRYRAQHDLLPHVVRGGRLWFRRDYVEQAAAARAFRARRQQGAS